MLVVKNNRLGIRLSTENPLSAAQWDAIASLEPRWLKSVDLAEVALDIKNIKTLARHSTITTLILFAHNQIRVDSNFIAEVANIRSVETLRISKTVLPYDGGLEHLRRLPKLNTLDLIDVEVPGNGLDKLREALPHVKLRHEPMKPDYRAQLDEMVLKQAKAASSAP